MPWFNLVRHVPALWQNERTRTQILSGVGLIAGVGGALASYAFLREPLQVRLDHLTIHLPNATGHLPKSGIRLLHLSDTHFRGSNWREQAKIDCIRKACAGLEYDMLIHTGDFLHEDSGLPNVLALLDALPTPRLGGFAVFGNHDYSIYSHDKFLERAWSNFQAQSQVAQSQVAQAQTAQPQATRSPAAHGSDNGSSNWNGNGYTTPESLNGHTNGNSNGGNNNGGNSNGRATPLSRARTLYQFGQYCANVPMDFRRSGRNDVNALEAALCARQIQILHNRYIRLSRPELGIDLYLAGVDDVIEGSPELPRALSEIPYDAPTILLSHNPDILGEPGVEQADLVLSGHTHGGQVVLPLLGAAHTQTHYLQRNEAAGYLQRGKTQIYITRGVGEGIPLRFGAAPQITLLTLLPA